MRDTCIGRNFLVDYETESLNLTFGTMRALVRSGLRDHGWNYINIDDPDMLIIGHTRWNKPNGCRLSSDEQYSHVTLWCLLSGPLLLGCDLEKLDAFTLGLLTNDEVLEINQDPLCQQAKCIARDGDRLVYAKQLENGAWAVGLFNRDEKPLEVALNWSDLDLRKPQLVRDLWRQKDLGLFGNRFATQVASHGVVLIRVSPP